MSDREGDRRTADVVEERLESAKATFQKSGDFLRSNSEFLKNNAGSSRLKGNHILFIFKYILTGNIFSPFPTKIPFDHPWPLHEFIRTEQKIHPHNRQLQYKSSEESKGYCIYPHINSITDQTKLCITTCPEHTGDQGCIYGRPHNIVAVDQKHIFQIMHGSGCQGRSGNGV